MSGIHCNLHCIFRNEWYILQLALYIRSRDKMAVLGYAYVSMEEANTSHSPKRCTSRNSTDTRFLEVQIPPRVLVYDWDP